jgi:hypothetical protein
MIRVERGNRTAIWNFGLQRGNFSIRLGIGGGKVRYGDWSAGQR